MIKKAGQKINLCFHTLNITLLILKPDYRLENIIRKFDQIKKELTKELKNTANRIDYFFITPLDIDHIKIKLFYVIILQQVVEKKFKTNNYEEQLN